MTPAEYTALVKAWRNKERRKQSRFAMLALVAAKCAGNKDSALDDFMGGLAEDAE
jgi:hypothetical protein